VDPATQDVVATTNLVRLAEAVSDLGGVVLIEPLAAGLNGAYPLLTAKDAIDVVDRVSSVAPAVDIRLLAVFFHLASNGENLSKVLREYGDRIGHVQVADAPGRGEPGTGVLDFEALFAQLLHDDYHGYVGLEYKPTTTTAESLRWLPRRHRARLSIGLSQDGAA
jgi:hydroxypyruvate isomerase